MPKGHRFKSRYTAKEERFLEEKSLLNLVWINREALEYVKEYGRFPPDIHKTNFQSLSRRLKRYGLINSNRNAFPFPSV
jgi:hypothetical protein